MSDIVMLLSGNGNVMGDKPAIYRRYASIGKHAYTAQEASGEAC